MKASLLYKSECSLGEGAFWHEARQSFFWVDIDGKCLMEFVVQTGSVRTWRFHYRPSFIALDPQGQFVIAFQGGLARFDLQTENLQWLVNIENKFPDQRSNDGAIDSHGRLWIGTMNVKFKEGAGKLYRIDSNLVATKMVEDLTIPNGLVWSLDNRTMYHIDSPTRTVKAYQFNSETGEISFDRIAITIPTETGSPDGMCIDEEGKLWIAQWNGFGVYRWDPIHGKLLDKIEVPVPQVSSCTFGGKNFDQLFITTARENFTTEQLLSYPDSGSIYIAQPGVQGIRKNIFGG